MSMELAPYQPPDVSSTDITFRAEPVEYHGPQRLFVTPGRHAVVGDWPASRPEDCDSADIPWGTWLHGVILACEGCGLDCT